MPGATAKVAAKLAKAKGQPAPAAEAEPKAARANGKSKQSPTKGTRPLAGAAKLAAERKAAREANEAKATRPTSSSRSSTKSAKRASATSKSSSKRSSRSRSGRKVKSKGSSSRRSSSTPIQPSEGKTKAKVVALYKSGKSRREIADELGISYGAVFNHTKGVKAGSLAAGEGATGRGRIWVDIGLDADGGKTKSKEKVSRSEAFRREFLAGMDIGDIGRKYGVRYQIVYTAVKDLIDRG